MSILTHCLAPCEVSLQQEKVQKTQIFLGFRICRLFNIKPLCKGTYWIHSDCRVMRLNLISRCMQTSTCNLTVRHSSQQCLGQLKFGIAVFCHRGGPVICWTFYTMEKREGLSRSCCVHVLTWQRSREERRQVAAASKLTSMKACGENRSMPSCSDQPSNRFRHILQTT